MKRHHLISSLMAAVFALTSVATQAQTEVTTSRLPQEETKASPAPLHLVNDEYQVWLDIDLDDQTITVPDQEIFGAINGYIGAKRDPRKWLVTAVEKIDDHNARLEIINDYGSEDLLAMLTLLQDGSYQLRQLEGSPLRIVVKSKWLKLPKVLPLKLLTKEATSPQ